MFVGQGGQPLAVEVARDLDALLDVVVRVAVARDVLEHRQLRAHGLVLPRGGLLQRALGVGQLLLGHSIVDVLELLEELLDGVRRVIGLDPAGGVERTRTSAPGEAAAGAVGPALVLAQVEVDATVERAAQDVVQDEQRIEVGVGRGHRRVADADLGLRRARLVDQVDASGASDRIAVREGRRVGAGRRRLLRPGLEHGTEVLLDAVRIQSADVGHAGTVRHSVLTPEGAYVADGQLGHGRSRSDRRPTQHGIAAHQPIEDVRGDGRGAIGACLDRGQSLLLPAREVAFVEAGLEHDLCQDLDRLREVLLEAGEGDLDFVFTGRSAQRRAHGVEGLGQLRRAHARGALKEHLGCQRSQTERHGRLVDASGRNGQRELDQRQFAVARSDDRHAAGVLRVPDLGGAEDRCGARRRALCTLRIGDRLRCAECGLRQGQLRLALGDHRDQHGRSVDQIALEDTSDVGRRDGEVPLELVLETVGMSEEGVVLGQSACLGRDGFQPAQEIGFVAVLDALQVFGIDPGLGQRLEQLVLGLGQRVEAVPGRGAQSDREGARELRAAVIRRDRARERAFDRQGTVQHGRLVRRQDASEHVQCCFVGVFGSDGRPGRGQLRQLDAVLDHDALRAIQRDRARLGRFDFGTAGDRTKPLRDQRPDLLEVDVSADGERGVVRPVPAAEEALDVFQARRREVFVRADGQPAVRVVGRIERSCDRAAHPSVRTVLVVLPALVLHDVALSVELLLVDRGQQEAHAVGFQPQPELELVGRQRFEVVRAVRVSRAVERTSGFADELEVLLVADVLRALEHDVFEQMREARAAGFFTSTAHVVHDENGDDRIRMVFVDDDLQAVVELEALEGDVDCLGHGGGCCQNGDKKGDHSRCSWSDRPQRPKRGFGGPGGRQVEGVPLRRNGQRTEDSLRAPRRPPHPVRAWLASSPS